MLRLLIGAGVVLMVIGFGAAGWQYWSGQRNAEASVAAGSDGAAGQTQVWLISPTGSIVPQEESRAYLDQGRLVPERTARLTLTAGLEGLLLPDEKLPEAPYLEVLADIRAPKLAQTLCPILTAAFARSCVIHSARVVRGSVDAMRSEARFEIELAFQQKADPAGLPDLAQHVLRSETVFPDSLVVPPSASVEAALTELVGSAMAACSPEDRVATCRVMGLALDWTPGGTRQASARLAWLAPLPQGMTTIAPIEPAPEG